MLFYCLLDIVTLLTLLYFVTFILTRERDACKFLRSCVRLFVRVE